MRSHRRRQRRGGRQRHSIDGNMAQPLTVTLRNLERVPLNFRGEKRRVAR